MLNVFLEKNPKPYLHMDAMRYAFNAKTPKMAQMLLAYGFNLNTAGTPSLLTYFLSHYDYADPEWVTFARDHLLSSATINAQDQKGETVLMKSAKESFLSQNKRDNQRALIQEMLLKGANITIKNKDQKTAKELAKDRDIVSLLGNHENNLASKKKPPITGGDL